MPLTKLNPNTILLSDRDDSVIIDHYPSGEATIVPGHLVELFSNSGILSWRRSSAAADEVQMFVALEREFFVSTSNNQTMLTPWADGSEICVASIPVGGKIWGLIASGQNIAVAGALQSAGDGTFKAATATTAAANVAKFRALESSGGAVNTLTRIRVMRVQ